MVAIPYHTHTFPTATGAEVDAGVDDTLAISPFSLAQSTYPIGADITAEITAAVNLRVLKAGDTMTGKLNLPASAVGAAPINIGSGTAPSAPVDGDLWVATTGSTFQWRAGGATFAAVNNSTSQSISGAKTFVTNPAITITTGNASLVMTAGTAGNALLDLRKSASGQFSQITGKTAAVLRWEMNLGNATAEGGANAGSNFSLLNYDDAGSVIGTALSITRSNASAVFSGNITGANVTSLALVNGVTGTFSGVLTGNSVVSTTTVAAGTTVSGVTGTFSGNVGAVNVTGSGAVTGNTLVATTSVTGATGVFSGAVSTGALTTTGNSTITGTLGGVTTLGAVTGNFSGAISGTIITASNYVAITATNPLIQLNKTASTNVAQIESTTNNNRRWRLDMANATAESGSNAGSDLTLQRYDDAGSVLGTSISIARSNGTISFTGLVNSALAVKVMSATATPAGGQAGSGLTFGTANNLGIFFGSGAPTLIAAQGSIYINTTGSTTATRLYVNTTGAAIWTNFVSAT